MVVPKSKIQVNAGVQVEVEIPEFAVVIGNNMTNMVTNSSINLKNSDYMYGILAIVAPIIFAIGL